MLKRSTADLKMNLLLMLACSDGLPRVGIGHLRQQKT